ncbi:MAG: THUMP domain-containing class I SAM-dependent RNA methyltransferase [Desulfobacterales bacterium]
MEFFAAVSPGLEPLCLRELKALSLAPSEGRTAEGGVSFNGRLSDGYLANLCLRTANRVLMRIAAFTASNFFTLEKKLAAIPWELYLYPGQPLRFNVTSRHSRLYHGVAIAERFQKVITARWVEVGVDPKPNHSAAFRQRLFIRVVDDRFAVSLDSSGYSLYRRGLKKQVTAAPLRETIAAAMLMLAGYSPPEPLIDPMCGAGSFSLEAAMQARNIPAGWFRDFAFSGWPAFALTHRRWKHIKDQCAQRIVDTGNAAIFAADIDPQACRALEENAANCGLSASIAVSNRDFFDLTPREFGIAPGLLIINPPFGRRMGSLKQSDALFQDLCKRLKAVWSGWRVAMVVPRKNLLKQIPFPFSVQGIRHGGLRLYLTTGGLRS